MEEAATQAGKRPKKDEDEGQLLGKQQERLLKQLEARVRTLEFENVVQRFLPKEHAVIVAVEECYTEYLEKEKQQEVKGKLGSPHVQQFAALASALGSLWSAERFPGNKRLAKVPERIVAALQRNPEAIMIEEWVKVCGTSDTYEGKKKRLSLDVRGSIRIAADEAGAEELLQKEAAEGLATFLELPLPLPATGSVMDLEKVILMLLRDLGAEARSGRAPRGPLARGGKK